MGGRRDAEEGGGDNERESEGERGRERKSVV